MKLKLKRGAKAPFLIATPECSYNWRPGETKNVPHEIGQILLDRYPELFVASKQKFENKKYKTNRYEKKHA